MSSIKIYLTVFYVVIFKCEYLYRLLIWEDISYIIINHKATSKFVDMVEHTHAEKRCGEMC